MSQVRSADGTTIAFERTGQGPVVILVDGALCSRAFGPMPDLAALLAPDFTVYTYDRRGRNESGDAEPYSVEREVEDVDALIAEAGGSACLFGTSSGACLAFEAASRLGARVSKLAMYEPPYNDDPGAQVRLREYTRNLTEALAEGRRGDAVELFVVLVGTPPEMVAGVRKSPFWPAFEAVAPTLAYDNAVLGDGGTVPVAKAASVKAQALVMNGGASLDFMGLTADKLAKAMPNARRRTLAGQTHEVDLSVLAPVLSDFFSQ